MEHCAADTKLCYNCLNEPACIFTMVVGAGVGNLLSYDSNKLGVWGIICYGNKLVHMLVIRKLKRDILLHSRAVKIDFRVQKQNDIPSEYSVCSLLLRKIVFVTKASVAFCVFMKILREWCCE